MTFAPRIKSLMSNCKVSMRAVRRTYFMRRDEFNLTCDQH